MSRHPFWDFYAGAGLIGLLIALATLDLGMIAISAFILISSAIHWSRYPS